MQTYFDCLPCFFTQALNACRFMQLTDPETKRILDAVAERIKDIPMQSAPPETGRQVYRIIREYTRNPDPYKQVKQENTARALSLYPAMKQMVDAAEDRLLAAIKIATAGNVIDCGVNKPYEIETEIGQIMHNEFGIFDESPFRKHLHRADRVLYIGDNAGECVFDRVLIEELEKPVIYVVRSHPVINDATIEDALEAGIDRVAQIVSSGTDAPGTVLSTCTDDFLALFENSDIVISKGQGNYEALSGQDRPVFFLLKAKCGVVAADLDVREGQMVFKGPNT
ncbi:MAG: damage-control phosphatase ARMT1 family protein [Thermodesulfobacteriota bacterium]